MHRRTVTGVLLTLRRGPDRRRAAIAVAAVALALFAAAAPTAGETGRSPTVSVTADDRAGGAHIEAEIDIAAPRPLVWSIMLDCEASVRIVEGLRSCSILSRDPAGAWDIREHIIRRYALLPSVRSVFRSDYVANSTIQFTRVDGDLKRLEGIWRLTARSDHQTIVSYSASVDLALPVPGALLRASVEADIAGVLRALQREAEARHGR